jgi:transcription initiation factor IIF auxiliary subunit
MAVLEGIALVAPVFGNEVTRGWGKYMARILDHWWAFLVKVAAIAQTAAIVQAKIFKLHLSFSKHHRDFHLRS